MPSHFTDHDSVCIHCGMDTCDWPRGERLPPCPVYDEETRAANVREWQRSRESEWDNVPDPDPFPWR